MPDAWICGRFLSRAPKKLVKANKNSRQMRRCRDNQSSYQELQKSL